MKSRPRPTSSILVESPVDSLSRRIIDTFPRRLNGDTRGDDEFRKLTWEFHRLDEPEEFKLRVKDKLLVATLAVFRQKVDAALKANDITRTEAILFYRVADIFDQIEAILWELKKLPGEPPKYPHPPEPKPPEPEPKPPEPKKSK